MTSAQNFPIKRSGISIIFRPATGAIIGITGKDFSLCGRIIHGIQQSPISRILRIIYTGNMKYFCLVDQFYCYFLRLQKPFRMISGHKIKTALPLCIQADKRKARASCLCIAKPSCLYPHCFQRLYNMMSEKIFSYHAQKGIFCSQSCPSDHAVGRRSTWVHFISRVPHRPDSALGKVDYRFP